MKLLNALRKLLYGNNMSKDLKSASVHNVYVRKIDPKTAINFSKELRKKSIIIDVYIKEEAPETENLNKPKP